MKKGIKKFRIKVAIKIFAIIDILFCPKFTLEAYDKRGLRRYSKYNKHGEIKCQ